MSADSARAKAYWSQFASVTKDLPARGNSAAAAFYRAYEHGDQPGLKGGERGSAAYYAYKAGLARRKADRARS